MSRKTMHRKLQRLAEDELGKPPKLTTCVNVLRDAVRQPGVTDEEHLAAVFLANRERLVTSAQRKAGDTVSLSSVAKSVLPDRVFGDPDECQHCGKALDENKVSVGPLPWWFCNQACGAAYYGKDGELP